MKKEIIIYTDGSSLGNPGESGWGSIFLVGKKVMEIGGYQKDATNNQMELEAILKSFEKLVEKNISNYSVEIFSDSKYCIQGITEWIFSWKKNSWKNSAKKPVKNKEYWEKIDNAKRFLEMENKIKFIHVKAHNGEKFNERVDDIARGMAESKGKDFKLFAGDFEKYQKEVL